MVLINNFNLVDGSEWTADLANLAFDPVFNDQTQFLNNHPRLTDDSLSNIAGNVKPRLNAIEDTLRVSATTGVNITWTAGTVALPDGTLASISSGNMTLPNDGTTFIWVNAAGVVAQGGVGVVPAIRLMLARVVTGGGLISTIENRRTLSVRPVLPVASAIKVFGGASVNDFVPTNNATYSDGYIFCRDFIIPQGMTIFINGYAKVFASGRVSILGTISVNAATSGASVFTTFGISGGVSFGGQSGAGLGAGSGAGGSNTTGQPYSYAASSLGSGGAGGFVTGAAGATLQSSTGGRGGGCLWIEAAGTVMVGATGRIQCNGTVGLPGAATGGFTGLASGGGGGSGGLVYLSSLTSVTCSVGSVIEANGGAGTIGANNGAGLALGGGGGGGGWVVFASSSINNAASVLVNGGAAGAAVGSGGAAGGGAGGSFGGGGGSAGGAVSVAGNSGQIIQLPFSPVGL
jgi:hypothetical protein